MKPLGPVQLGGAIYVLPNLLTTGNLFFGFFSIIKCLQGDFVWACSAILLAIVFDFLDGRVARLTNATSEFGVQYDSLCDLVSFGLAPSFVIYQYALSTMGRIGWIMCFVYLACGALRLARFNVQSAIGKAGGDFVGLPIPAAGSLIACLILSFLTIKTEIPALADLVEDGYWPRIMLSTLTPCVSLLMVSNITYRSHKTVRITALKPFNLLVILVVIIGLIAYQPEFCGFILIVSFVLSGPVEHVLGWRKAADDDDIFTPLKDHYMEPASNQTNPLGFRKSAHSDGTESEDKH